MAAEKDQGALELFRAAVSVPDEQIDLVEAALLLAQGEYPALDRSIYRQKLDGMGREASQRLRDLRPDLQFRPEYLDPVSHRQILTRILNNLLPIYLSTSRFPKALAMLERIFCLEPEEPERLRQLAVVHYHLKQYARAAADLEAYLARVPDAPDRAELTEQLAALRHLCSMVN